MDKIYGDKTELTANEEAEVEKVVVKMDAVYAKIETIEHKVMVELYGENYETVGGICGPMADDELGSADDYIDSLEMLNENEKGRLKEAYDKIEKLYMEYDKIEESQQSGPKTLEILTKVDEVMKDVKDIEDKITIEGESDFEIGATQDTLENAYLYVDELKLDKATKNELKKLYSEVFKLYEDLNKLYSSLDGSEVQGEFSEKDKAISDQLETAFNRIYDLEQKANK